MSEEDIKQRTLGEALDLIESRQRGIRQDERLARGSQSFSKSFSLLELLSQHQALVGALVECVGLDDRKDREALVLSTLRETYQIAP